MIRGVRHAIGKLGAFVHHGGNRKGAQKLRRRSRKEDDIGREVKRGRFMRTDIEGLSQGEHTGGKKIGFYKKVRRRRAFRSCQQKMGCSIKAGFERVK